MARVKSSAAPSTPQRPRKNRHVLTPIRAEIRCYQCYGYCHNECDVKMMDWMRPNFVGEARYIRAR